jgi:hypothetical protein
VGIAFFEHASVRESHRLHRYHRQLKLMQEVITPRFRAVRGSLSKSREARLFGRALRLGAVYFIPQAPAGA